MTGAHANYTWVFNTWFLTDRRSLILGVLAAPGGRETLQKRWVVSPPIFGRTIVSRPRERAPRSSSFNKTTPGCVAGGARLAGAWPAACGALWGRCCGGSPPRSGDRGGSPPRWWGPSPPLPTPPSFAFPPRGGGLCSPCGWVVSPPRPTYLPPSLPPSLPPTRLPAHLPTHPLPTCLPSLVVVRLGR